MRTKPPREVLDRRKASRKKRKEQPQESRGRKIASHTVTLISLLATVLGVWLTAIEFQARPTASLDTPLDPSDVFTTPLVISNDGQLALNDLHVVWYVKEIRYKNGSDISRVTAQGFVPESSVLDVGERKTIAYPRRLKIGIPATSVDIVAAVYFKPSYWPFGRRHRLFHLVGTHQSDGSLRLQLQPSREIAAEAERMLPR